jgi:hypothetical protein
MRVAVVLYCLMAGAVAVYPESSVTGASRSTEYTKSPGVRQELPVLTEAMINDWVRVWSRRLGLSEWKIDSKVVRLALLPRGTVANVHWSLPRRTATIKVLDPVDSTLPPGEIIRDTELSVVHELVHLSMAKLPLDGNDTDLEEQVVKRISLALLALDKGDEKPPVTTAAAMSGQK